MAKRKRGNRLPTFMCWSSSRKDLAAFVGQMDRLAVLVNDLAAQVSALGSYAGKRGRKPAVAESVANGPTQESPTV